MQKLEQVSIQASYEDAIKLAYSAILNAKSLGVLGGISSEVANELQEAANTVLWHQTAVWEVLQDER